jgi:hypothetical protein
VDFDLVVFVCRIVWLNVEVEFISGVLEYFTILDFEEILQCTRIHGLVLASGN